MRPTRKFLAFLITALAELITGKCNGNLGGERGKKEGDTSEENENKKERER